MFSDQSSPLRGGWVGFTRVDGTIVQSSTEAGTWEVVAFDGEIISRCPCCHKAFFSAEAAQKAANIVFPLNPSPDPRRRVDQWRKITTPMFSQA